jgi:curved DNA-binding protein
VARKYHPDLNPNDKQAEIKFKEQANEVLSNSENRKNTINTKTGNRVQNMKKKQKQQSQYQGSQQQTNFNGFEGDDYSDFFDLCLQVKVAEQELQAIKDKILTLNYI